MTSMALWWSVLAAGTLLLTLSGAAATTRVSRGRRVPRLGFFPPRHLRPPWWALAGLCIGIFLMTVGAGRLSETKGSYFAYFGGAAAVAVLIQAVAAWRHNRRLTSQLGRDAVPEGTAGLRAK